MTVDGETRFFENRNSAVFHDALGDGGAESGCFNGGTDPMLLLYNGGGRARSGLERTPAGPEAREGGMP